MKNHGTTSSSAAISLNREKPGNETKCEQCFLHQSETIVLH